MSLPTPYLHALPHTPEDKKDEKKDEKNNATKDAFIEDQRQIIRPKSMPLLPETASETQEAGTTSDDSQTSIVVKYGSPPRSPPYSSDLESEPIEQAHTSVEDEEEDKDVSDDNGDSETDEIPSLGFCIAKSGVTHDSRQSEGLRKDRFPTLEERTYCRREGDLPRFAVHND